MRTRLIILVAVLALAGFASLARHGKLDTTMNEAWVAKALPLEVPGYKMRASDANPMESYHMDDETYKKLKPYGIVARIFEQGNKAIDTVVIAGDSPDNFHDPTWCLPGQGWKLDDRKDMVVHTQSRGDVPFSYFSATNASGDKLLVAYTFKAGGGYHATITKLTLDMWSKEFFSGQKQVGAFYRFLTLDSNTSLDGLTKFAADYLDKAKNTSGGVF